MIRAKDGRLPAVLVVAVLTLLRLVMATLVPLAPDEAYYWTWSHALAPGYVDHPPMVALWIKAGTTAFGQTALGARLLGPLSAAAASWMLFDSAARLFPGRKSGLAAVCLLNGSLLLGVGTVIMTPDAPLLFFWTAAMWALVRLIDSADGRWWPAAGLCGGLALQSKYTALMLWGGVGLWVLMVPAVRPWLRRWQPWAAIVLGGLLFAPVVIWNATHGWASFARQGGRVGDWAPMRAVGFLAELIGGQIGLATPGIFWLCMVGLVVTVRRAWTRREPRWSLLAALSAPAVLVFAEHAIGDRVQGNWPAVIYPALALAASGLVRPGRNYVWIGASAVGFAFTAVVYVQAAYRVIPLPPRLDPIALQLAGWDGLARQVEARRAAADGRFVVSDSYAVASELAWWSPAGVPVVGVEERWALTTLPAAKIAGLPGLLVRDARRAEPPDPTLWGGARLLGVADRPGSPARFAIYLVTATGRGPAAFEMPRR